MEDNFSQQLTYDSIVLCMGADPEPDYIALGLHGQGTVRTTNPNGEETTDALEVERRMCRIVFE